MSRTRYAHSNVALYGQALAAGYDAQALARLSAAYGLATRLHSARFRPTGYPLLAHLVRTASILLAAGARPHVVCAGLLHASYEQGDHGDGRAGVTDQRRATLQRVIGTEAESRVASYSAADWSAATLAARDADFDTLDPIARDVILIRIANEIEDHLDTGILYCADAEARLAALDAAEGPTVRLAHRLGHPDLGATFAHVAQECRNARVPAALRHPMGYAFDVIPPSLRRRPLAAVRHHLPRLRSYLRRAGGRRGPR